MTRFKLPRYEGTNAARIAELHDQHVDRLVATYTARRRTTRPEPLRDVPDADQAPGTNPQ